ncbi:30S ribosomal protein S12 methylthiotransferase RimO, partial [Eubacteriales bacterium OttesenSCG-928-G02]|nr:30S ribosomal protein S12 methylthiotransferase RimO [Eubacteriales bacterium OttesenSCG-928-G02]
MAIKVGFVSLGCPKNLINTEKMLSLLAQAGYVIVAEDIEADVVVINTCAFIESAKQEAIDNVLDIAWLKENNGLKGIVLTGCMAERYRDEIFKEMPEVTAILGTGSYDQIISAVEAAYKNEKYSSYNDKNEISLEGERVITTPEYFAYLQIAEGCDNHCTYCVIPSVRGEFRSRKMSDIMEEAEELAKLGVKELCLVAQDTTRYGEDIYGIYSLDSLLKELSTIEGIEWIRLLYCYADRITDDLINEMAENPKVVKYIDMPIQHISDPILKKMNRRDTEESIRNIIKKLRDKMPDITIRTTIITGFPGETEADHEKLLSFINEIKFERLGVFEYSREEDTPAYEMENQISDKIKHKRYGKLMSAQQKIHKE